MSTSTPPGTKHDLIDKMTWDDYEDNQRDHGSVSLIELFQVQTDRRKGPMTCQPMQASDSRDSDCVVNGEGISASSCSEEPRCSQDNAIASTPDYLFDSAEIKPLTSPHASPTLTKDDNTYNDIYATAGFATSDQGKTNHQNDVDFTGVGTHAPLFGKLPDPIRLSEQTGLFDGQVVFIGHPNRDVSAHQWSSLSFQWMNIGRYASSRGQIEGSLASDRVRGAGEPQDTLEYFKLAAEHRQTLIVEYGRSKDRTTKVNVAVPTPRISRDPPLNNMRLVPQASNITGETLSSTTRDKIAKHSLEDPFTAATRGSASQASGNRQVHGNLTGSMGSLDLTYRFPPRVGIAEPSLVAGSGTSGIRSTVNSATSCLAKPVLQDIAFTESSTHPNSSSVNNENFQLLRTNTAYQHHQRPAQCRDNSEVSESTLLLHSAVVSGAEIPDSAVGHASPTNPVVPAAVTTSLLNATAVPYAMITIASARPGVPESNTDTADAALVGLRYSDPDSLRRDQRHEVANGLNQQAPTPQTFHGPFFTESKPTTHNPTAALSVRVSEEEKLKTWFRDGHRPARQKEYTKSLIVAAAASARTRHFGPIGKASARVEGGPYANTAPFVRLYETLSEYVEEYRNDGNGSGRSYFTRGWKPASPQLREAGVDSSASYFSKRSGHPRRPRVALFRPSERHLWG